MSDDLCSLPATTLRDLLARGDVSSREVVDAHLDRIGTYDHTLRAFTQVFSEEARAEADVRDDERRRGISRGLLHGLPVTIKECFDLVGLPTTMGVRGLLHHRAARDAVMATMLRESGAVILGRTNLSQTMLFAESRNPIYGQTANPFSLDHTPGGSSGGEAAAIAAGLSPLGVGTDIGGSIRTPCSFTGITGFKPTLDRLPSRGQNTLLKGQEAVRSQSGPMARTVADLDLFFRAMDPVRMSALDPKVPPLPWRPLGSLPARGLRVGYYANDGVVPVSTAVARAVEVARAALSASGCETVPFTPPDVASLFDDYLAAMSADGGEGLMEALSEDPVDPTIAPLLSLAKLPDALRRGMATASKMGGQAGLSRMLNAMGKKSVRAFWGHIDALRRYRVGLLDMMDAVGVDVILCPAYATPALPHGMSKNFTAASTSALLYNAVQFPAGVVPVTRVRPDETKRPSPQGLIERHAAKVDAKSAGLPVGVQLVARPWQDEVAMAAMATLEAALRDHGDVPRTPVTP
jgi:fatty acid amide hydrolase